MGDLSAHFSKSEFACKHCGKQIAMSPVLIDYLEKLYTLMGAKSININSGYRCPNSPYGTSKDAHRIGYAADIMVRKQDGSYYTAQDIAEVAERVGFGGIGLMPPHSCHVDVRQIGGYSNTHWFGNEATGENFIKTFQRGTQFVAQQTATAINKAKELQQILNAKGASLVVDGIIGVKTLSILKGYSIELGDKGVLTKWVQEVLNAKGFNCGTADGVAGQKTISALQAWQKANGLGVGKFYGSDWETFVKGV